LFRSEKEDEALAKERQETIWAILDEHYERLPDEAQESEPDKTWRLCLARMDRRKMTISTETKVDKVLLMFNPELDPELKKYSEDTLAKINEGMQYLPLVLWTRHRWEESSSEYSKYAQYDSDHKHVVTDTKAICEGLKTDNTGDKRCTVFYRSVPPTACAVLLRDFADKLNAEEQQFCKNILLEYSSLPCRGSYPYQVGDGVVVAIKALPLLLKLFPECCDEVKRTLLFTLFDQNPVGMNQPFSGHAVEAIINTLRKLSPEDADSLFIAYLHLQPKFAHLCNSMLKEKRRRQVSQFEHFTAIQRFADEQKIEISKAIRNEITFDQLPSIIDIEVDTLVTSFLLLPLGTKLETQNAFVVELASIVAKRVRRHGRHGDEQLDYGVRHRFLVKFAHFVLSADKSDMPRFVRPLIENFNRLDYAEDAFQEFVRAEDNLNQYDSFWAVWEQFYPCIVDLCKNGGGYHSSDTIHNYLLAWPWWRKDAREWHSLKEREKGFFQRVAKDIGDHPAVLYSLAKLLNEIGSAFAADGIFWISTILESHPDLRDKELETNSAYYLENLVRGYVLLNREKVRSTPRIKSAVLTILNVLLEKGSVTAYLTREYLL